MNEKSLEKKHLLGLFADSAKPNSPLAPNSAANVGQKSNLLLEKNRRRFVIWLFSVCGLILAMVVIGGITRLTRSGLSIVEWNPVTGILPPLSESDWADSFHKYQMFPEYQKLNFGMSLADYKTIFFWEYLHRLIGRLIGIAFFLPVLYFWKTGLVRGRLAWQLTIGFVLGGAQGALGWFMVKSGLVNDPHVSHFRLAAHLVLAFSLLSYLFYIALGQLKKSASSQTSTLFKIFTIALIPVVFIQVIYGAFTAGLHAGLNYNTFPLMNGEFFPALGTAMNSVASNLFENPTTVQFIHRTLGWLILFTALGVWISSRGLSTEVRKTAHVLVAVVLLQFVLGVSTLVMQVPITLASIHQLGAGLVILSVTFCAWVVFGKSQISEQL